MKESFSILSFMFGPEAPPGGELCARLAAYPSTNEENIPVSLLAAHLDGGLSEEEREQVMHALAGSFAALQDAISASLFLESVSAAKSAAPASVIEAALAGRRGNVVYLSKRKAPHPESFLPLAAASDSGDKAVFCRSQSGLWTLEVFVGQSEEDKAAERGMLLLTVDVDCRETYEGLTARVFVRREGEEFILAEQPVRGGEVFAEISLRGLDFRKRDAVGVVFGPAPGEN